MVTLRLLEADAATPMKGGDLLACAYSPDGAFVLSAGWDGFLRLWDAVSGAEIQALQVGSKPLGCCALSPDGRRWLAGSIDGVLTVHDAETLDLVASVQAHTRPISSIRYPAPGGEGGDATPLLATSSWDRQVTLRRLGKDREARALSGHKDIVAGCRFTAAGGRLLSWSYDATLRLWDVGTGREERLLQGHEDRVTAADPSPDGLQAISGGRDGAVYLWDLTAGASIRLIRRPAEVRACFFLPDGASVVVVDAAGGVALLSTPDLEILAQAQTGVRPLAADLSPTSLELALACEDGQLRRVAVDGLEESALIVTATRRTVTAGGVFGRILGKRRVRHLYQYSCPACRRNAESGSLPTQPFACAGCRRRLCVSNQVRHLQEV